MPSLFFLPSLNAEVFDSIELQEDSIVIQYVKNNFNDLNDLIIRLLLRACVFEKRLFLLEKLVQLGIDVRKIEEEHPFIPGVTIVPYELEQSEIFDFFIKNGLPLNSVTIKGGCIKRLQNITAIENAIAVLTGGRKKYTPVHPQDPWMKYWDSVRNTPCCAIVGIFQSWKDLKVPIADAIKAAICARNAGRKYAFWFEGKEASANLLINDLLNEEKFKF